VYVFSALSRPQRPGVAAREPDRPRTSEASRDEADVVAHGSDGHLRPKIALDFAASVRQYPPDASDASGERMTRVRSSGIHIDRALWAAALAAVVVALIPTHGTAILSFASRTCAFSPSLALARPRAARLADRTPAFSLQSRDPLAVDSRVSSALVGDRAESTESPVVIVSDAREAAEYAGKVTKSIERETRISTPAEVPFRVARSHRRA
jgi:hypothetical protein